MVHRLAENLIVSFDNDAAGSDAAERAIDLAEASDFSVSVATFTDFKDAAEAAQADPENIRKVVESAVPAPEFYFRKYLPTDPVSGIVNSSAIATREGLNHLRTVIAKLKHIASPVERDYWFKELSKRTGIAEKTLDEEAGKMVGSPATSSFARTSAGEAGEEAPKRRASRQELICDMLISVALVQNDFGIFDDSVEFLNPTQKEILRILKSGKRKSDDPSLDAAIEVIVLRASETLGAAEVAGLKSELAKEYYKERRKILSQAIKNAETRHDEKELAAALEELEFRGIASRKMSGEQRAMSREQRICLLFFACW